ncbi:hypothetical protein E4U32_000424 [Claviceps aff. humidiphila group G2b]|nr:hypothetical protein E4U32_000424 [Claviceps aff. humidiphila group G2b]
MEDASAPESTFLSALLHIINSAWSLAWSFPWGRYAALLARGVVFPLRVLWTPVSYLVGVSKAVFAPVAYVIDYAGGWVGYLVGVLIGLEPLYTFFSVAAFVGILTGIFMALLSALLTTSLNMHDTSDDTQVASLRAQLRRRLQMQARKEQYLQEQYLSGGGPLSQKQQQQQFGHESDWHWADPAALASSPKGSRFRRISSLQAETIHEEDDDDDSGQ